MKSFIKYYFLFLTLLFLVIAQAHAATVATGVDVEIIPNAPSSFTAVPDSTTQVALSWTDNSGNTEDGFSVERKTGVTGTYVVIATTATGIATYIDNTASAGTTYFYRVSAYAGTIYSPYSNEASVTTPTPSAPPSTPPSSGGGGGGGGGNTPPIPAVSQNEVTITGAAYPLSTVTILENGTIVLKTIAGPDGIFSASIQNSPSGSYNFYVYATDSEGRRSTPFTFPVTITAGATTNISGVFLSPTISLDKQEVKRGDPIVIFGQTLPSAPVIIQVDSAVPVFVSTTSSASGVYTYDFDSSDLELGSHLARSEVQAGNLLSSYSLSQSFTVGDQNIIAATSSISQCPVKGDFNGDCKVNLIDFSILAYWYGQSTAPAIYELDKKSSVDLTDFSILAYYWTG